MQAIVSRKKTLMNSNGQNGFVSLFSKKEKKTFAVSRSEMQIWVCLFVSDNE